MQFTQLRNFVAIVDMVSIRACARQLGISQPAVTKALRALEQEGAGKAFPAGAKVGAVSR